jgi:hypothetical protein
MYIYIYIYSCSNIPTNASILYIIPFSHLDNAITFVSRMIIVGRLTCSWRGQPTSNQNMVMGQKAVPPYFAGPCTFAINAPLETAILTICNLQSAICNVIMHVIF